MSIDEKQSKLLKWFQNDHTMYTIKEIESNASKKTGISSMQIKDILKMLVDDGLVNCEKCGISNIYWSFQYTGIMKLNNDYERLKIRKDDMLKSIDNYKEKIKVLKNERKLGKKERNKLIETINKLTLENNEINKKIDKLIERSPEKLETRLSVIKEMENSIEIMMDNFDILVSFIYDSNPSGMSKSEIREYFSIPNE